MNISSKTFCLLLCATVATAMAGPITPVPEKITGAVADRQDFQIPDWVHQDGWVGLRSAAGITNRLGKVDLERMLEGFR